MLLLRIGQSRLIMGLSFIWRQNVLSLRPNTLKSSSEGVWLHDDK